MKTIRELKTLDLSSYFFKEMIKILHINPEYFMVNDVKGCKNGSVLFKLCYSDENDAPHNVFNNIECIFKKSRIYSYLVFCGNNKNKDMLNNYVRIIDQIKEVIIYWVYDEIEDNSFRVGDAFKKFKFRAGDNLVYNEKINISVCARSLSSVIKRRNIYYPNFKLQRCFCENF